MTTETNSPKRLFTVLLLKPDYIADDYGHDTCLTHVEAHTVESAQELGQVIACHADCADEAEREDSNPEDYHVLAVFEGHLPNLKED